MSGIISALNTIDKQEATIDKLLVKIQSLKQDKAKLLECVKFYADKDIWDDSYIANEDVTEIISHGGFESDEIWDSYGGKLARQCLKDLGEE